MKTNRNGRKFVRQARLPRAAYPAPEFVEVMWGFAKNSTKPDGADNFRKLVRDVRIEQEKRGL